MKKLFIMVLSVASVLLLVGCMNPADPELDAFIKNLPRTNHLGEAKLNTTVLAESSSELDPLFLPYFQGQHEGINESEFYVAYLKYEAEGGFDRLLNYGEYDNILFPGAIVDVRSNTDIVPIRITQSPITMSISNATTTNVVSYRPYVMRSPSLSASRIGVNKLVNNSIDALAPLPARTQISGGEVTNLHEFGIRAGIGLNFPKIGISGAGDLSYRESTEHKVIYLRLYQIFYTVDIDSHNAPSQYFSSSVNTAEIMSKLEGTTPAIVSSVSYGRLALVKITITSENETISGLARVSDFLDLVNVTGEIDTLASTGEVDIQAFIYGGSLGRGSQLVSANSLQAVFDEFNDFEPDVAQALPIAFELRHIADFSRVTVPLVSTPIYEKTVLPKD